MDYTMYQSGMNPAQARAMKYSYSSPLSDPRFNSSYRNLNGQNGYRPTGLEALQADYKRRMAAKNKKKPAAYDVGAEYQKAVNKANRANDRRDKQIQAGYRKREEEANSLIAGQGEQARKDLVESYRQLGEAQDARLTGLGLGNTSVVGAMQQGNLRRRGDAVANLNESIDRQRLDTMGRMSGERLAYMERPNDVAPDLNQFLAIAQMQGKTGGYNGGGSGGYGGMTGAAPIFMGNYGANYVPFASGMNYNPNKIARQAASQKNWQTVNAARPQFSSWDLSGTGF